MSDPSSATQLTECDDLRARILSAACLVFDARGYAAATSEEVCSESGVDAQTLTELFPNKYELFRECAFRNARTAVAAIESAGAVPDDIRQARTVLVTTLGVILKTNLAHEASAGLLRGEHRSLTPEDQVELFAMLGQLSERVQQLLRRIRPGLCSADAAMLSVAALSTMSSVAYHPTTLPEQKVATLLTVSAMRVLESESALHAPTACFGPKQSPAWADDSSDRGRILAAGISLIYQRGFDAITLDDVADAAGVARHTVDKHFRSTADMLAGAFDAGQASLRSAMLGAAQSEVPREILLGLSHSYVEHYFTDPELMTVFLLDADHLPERYRAETMSLRLEFLGGWVAALRAVRPELAASEAIFLVHAALTIVADLGRLIKWNYDPETMAKIERLVVTTLIGGR